MAHRRVLARRGRRHSLPEIRSDTTNALLAEMDVGWPATDAAFFALAFEQLIDARVLPAPTRHLDAMRAIFGPVVRNR